MTEIELMEQEIRDLQCDLNVSDYKVIKYTEYVAMGMEAPYDIAEVYVQRQAKRDRINELKAALAEMEVEE